MRLGDLDALKEDLKESKEKLWEIYNSLSDHHDKQICGGQIGTFTEVILRINDMPTIDAEVVCRCKDCKHRRHLKGATDEAHTCGLGWGLRGIVAEDDFCSYGERRGDGNAD